MKIKSYVSSAFSISLFLVITSCGPSEVDQGVQKVCDCLKEKEADADLSDARTTGMRLGDCEMKVNKEFDQKDRQDILDGYEKTCPELFPDAYFSK